MTATVGGAPARANDIPTPAEPTPMSQITTTMLGTGTVIVDQTNASSSHTLTAGHIYRFEAWGASGADCDRDGGRGNYATGWYDMRELSDRIITWFAGRQGSGTTGGISNLASSPTKYNGIAGGAGSIATVAGGGGGGASGIRFGSAELIIAGGGGGAGADGMTQIYQTLRCVSGGDGGGQIGGNGSKMYTYGPNGGYGGSQSQHGQGGENANGYPNCEYCRQGGKYSGGSDINVSGYAGSALSGGTSREGNSAAGLVRSGAGGGGGGGYAQGYSGGSGGAWSCSDCDYVFAGGGGGGSGGTSYIGGVTSISGSLATTTWAQRTGHGRVVITKYLTTHTIALPPQSGTGWVLL